MFSLVKRRYYSSLSQLEKQLLAGEVAVTKNIIDKAIARDEFHQLKSILKKNTSLLNSEVKNDLINHLPNDFSIYYLLKDHQWTPSQLTSLIASNPGRVDSSWDLFQRHQVEKTDELYVQLINKLMEGEGDFEENESLSNLEWSRIMYLYQQLENKQLIQDIILQELSEFNFSLVPLFDFSDQALLKKLEQGLKTSERVLVYQKLFQNGASLTHEQYASALSACFEVLKTTPDSVNNTEFFGLYSEVAKQEIIQDVGSVSDFLEVLTTHIVENKLDLDPAPESLLIRMKLMDVYGMQLENLEMMLTKFHQYQSHAPFGIEMVQLEVIQSYCYQAFNKEDPIFLKLVDALMLEEIPTKTLQATILANAALDIDKSLEIYNKYINVVSSKPNAHTGRSPSALLSESLIYGYLYNNDRSFAELLYERIIQSGQLTETEAALLKAPFKVFGEAWVDDSWEPAQRKLKLHIANIIKYL